MSKSSIAVTSATRERLRQLATKYFPGRNLNDVLAVILDDFEYNREQVRQRYLGDEDLMRRVQRARDEADEKGWLSTEDVVAYLAKRIDEERRAE
jgi:hypothetical protein